MTDDQLLHSARKTRRLTYFTIAMSLITVVMCVVGIHYSRESSRMMTVTDSLQRLVVARADTVIQHYDNVYHTLDTAVTEYHKLDSVLRVRYNIPRQEE